MPSMHESAAQEIREVRADCLALLAQIKALCPADPDGHYPDAFRLTATPMLYAVWERCFTLCHSISLRLLRDTKKLTAALSSHQKALWLQRQGFYQSFQDLIRVPERGDRRIKNGAFKALSDFIANFAEWSAKDIDISIDTDELVMCFSNVNPEVVALNAKVLGVDDTTAFKSIEFARLHELVGRRNEIGHGGIVTPPGNKEFDELWSYTEKLVASYCDAFEGWVAPPSMAAGMAAESTA